MMDRRQLKTRKAVYAAFTELLKEKPYSSITVQDIIDAADIGRSTFYAHFETKEDLLNVLCNEIFEHVFSEHLTGERTHDFSKEGNNILAELEHILYHLQENRGFISVVISSESGEVFMGYFREHLAQVFERETDRVPANVPRSYYLNHLVCGFADTVRWWMENECDPKDAVNYYNTLYLRSPRSL